MTDERMLTPLPPPAPNHNHWPAVGVRGSFLFVMQATTSPLSTQPARLWCCYVCAYTH